MRRLTLAIAVLTCLLDRTDALSAAAPSENATQSVQIPASDIVTMRRVHAVGDVRVKIGNDGTFASRGYGQIDEQERLAIGWDPTFEFPANSGRNHSFIGGLWVAGIRGWDTLASWAAGVWSEERRDFNALSALAFMTDSTRGYQRFTCTYTDTVLSSLLRRPEDSPPVGLDIRQTSHAFASPPYDRFVIVEYVIRNISGFTIRKPFVGFFDDCDVYHDRLTGQYESGYSDDLSGFLPVHTIAYAIDNNGDSQGDSLWLPTSSVTAMGIAPIYFDPPARCTTFNWWATNYGNIYWGPQRADNSYNFASVPTTPSTVHQTMGNAEIDYDQLWSAVDMRSQEWRLPLFGPAGVDVANGHDTRLLLSFGFRDLAPNDSIRVVITLAAGDSVHVAPSDFGQYFDPANPREFYDRLNFTDLIRNVTLARKAWAKKFDLDGASPAWVKARPIADSTVRCEWPPAPFYHVSGYRLYRRFAGEQTWSLIAHLGKDQLSWDDDGLVPGASYEYAVSSLDWNGNEGPKCRPMTVAVGYPLDRPILTAKNTPTAVALNWSFRSAPPGLSEYAYLNIYRWTPMEPSSTLYTRIPINARPPGAGTGALGSGLAASVSHRERLGIYPYDVLIDTSLLDENVESGVTYHYRASFTNALKLEGKPSAEVSATPMSLDRRGIVLYYTRGGSLALIQPDSVRAFYGPWAKMYGFDTLDIALQTVPYEARLPLELLSRYSCAILVAENWYGFFPVDPVEDQLETYLASGGRCVFVSRNHYRMGGTGNLTNSPNALVRRFLGIERVRPEAWIEYVEATDPGTLRDYALIRFLGARARGSTYPDLEGDSLEFWNDPSVQFSLRTVDSVFDSGFVAAVGCLDSIAPGTDTLYTYVSAYDTSFFHGKPIAVRRITDSTAAILFNIPLSLMKHEQAWRALTIAVGDLGIDTTHVEPPTSASVGRSLIRWLFDFDGSEPEPGWDVNGDGTIDIRDVVVKQLR